MGFELALSRKSTLFPPFLTLFFPNLDHFTALSLSHLRFWTQNWTMTCVRFSIGRRLMLPQPLLDHTTFAILFYFLLNSVSMRRKIKEILDRGSAHRAAPPRCFFVYLENGLNTNLAQATLNPFRIQNRE